MRFHLPKFSRPSTGTILGAIALFVALGGTALAATGTLVNIADSTHSNYIAKVSSHGELKTSEAPGAPFSHYATVRPGFILPITQPTNGTLAFSRLAFTNPSTQSAPVHVTLYEFASDSGTTCNTNGGIFTVATYEIKAGQTVLDPLPTPLVLKPRPGYAYWCLGIYPELNPYSTPNVPIETSANGAIVSGSFPTFASKRLYPKMVVKPRATK